MRRTAVAAVIWSAGCASILGIDNTRGIDAGSDAVSNACIGAPRCSFSSGRSICGQIVATGALAGDLVRAVSPTGASCPPAGTPSGPCSFGVFSQVASDYVARNVDNRTLGALDDCGRYEITDIDPAQTDVVVVLYSAQTVETAQLVLGRPAMAGIDSNVLAYAVGNDTAANWATQLTGSGSAAPTVTGGFLVTYAGATAPTTLTIDGSGVSPPPTVPWGAYFVGTAPYNALDLTLVATATSQSALVVPTANTTFTLGGSGSSGTTCSQMGLAPVANVIMVLSLLGC